MPLKTEYYFIRLFAGFGAAVGAGSHRLHADPSLLADLQCPREEGRVRSVLQEAARTTVRDCMQGTAQGEEGKMVVHKIRVCVFRVFLGVGD